MKENIEKWTHLIEDVRASLGMDPASAEAQSLAERWLSLVSDSTGGDTGIRENLQKVYTNLDNMLEEFSQYDIEIAQFISKAMEIRKNKNKYIQ